MAFELHRRLTAKTTPSQMRQMIPWETPAETALPKPLRKGRPKGCSRVQVVHFSIDEGMEMLGELAAKKNYALPWDWDGKGYPKRRRSQGPNQESLTSHAEILYHLLKLAPNGYPCPYRLRDLLIQLHNRWNIFPNDRSEEASMSLSNRAMLACDRWRLMCKHCLMLKSTNTHILYQNLQHVVNLVKPELLQPAVAPVEHDHNHDDDSLKITPTISRSVVPYTSDGIIDWGVVEDELPEPEALDCEIVKVDQSQCSSLNPYFHHSDDTDCTITAHRCGCCIDEHARKKCRTTPAETATPAEAAIEVDEIEEEYASPEPTAIHPNIAANKSAEETFAVPANLIHHLEGMANSAPPPFTTTVEKIASMKKPNEKGNKGKGSKVPSPAETAATARVKGKQVKGKHGGLKSQKKKGRQPGTKDPVIGPPWKIVHRFKPLEQAQCYIMGTVGGAKNKFITNINRKMHYNFSALMQQLHKEAIAGTFVTKKQAIRRRDQLLDEATG